MSEIQKLSNVIRQALLAEVTLTIKPGLVDQQGQGAHHDMDFDLFLKSIDAISTPIAMCYEVGYQTAYLLPTQTLAAIRSIGRQAESDMFNATQGVNTHKGAIFALGLLCAALGRCQAQQKEINVTGLCQAVAEMTKGLVARELATLTVPQSAGERLFLRYGLTGARGEAESGFRLVRQVALPTYLHYLIATPEQAGIMTLLQLMAINADTNLVSRGGVVGLRKTQYYAQSILTDPLVKQGDVQFLQQQLAQFDRFMIAHHLSPGGSADLLTITYFLSNLAKIAF